MSNLVQSSRPSHGYDVGPLQLNDTTLKFRIHDVSVSEVKLPGCSGELETVEE